MYRLIVVDDEDIIREGLCLGVDWKSMGFEVAADFEDGDGALSWLEENECDVVMTDIMMARTGGLELAQQVREKYPGVRVLILSGYQEFEYAKTAMRYGVSDYLLKPLRTAELRSVFARLREELDRERRDESMTQRQNREFLAAARTNFFRTLLSGQIRSEKELELHLTLLGLPRGLCDSPLFLCAVERQGEAGEDWIERLTETLPEEAEGCRLFALPDSQERCRLLIAAPPLQGRLDSAAEYRIRPVLDRLEERLGVSLRLSRTLLSTRSLVGSAHEDFEPLDAAERINEAASLALMSRYKLFVLRLNNDDQAGIEELLGAYMTELAHFLDPEAHFGYMRFMLKSLIASIAADYGRSGIDTAALTDGAFDGCRLLECADWDDLRETALGMLGVLRQALQQRETSPNYMIKRIEQYIREHLDSDISSEKLARIAHMNPSYFGRYFKKNTGEFINEYILRLRIEKAIELLREGRHKVGSISRMVGFSNPKYFYYQFKKSTGYTTTEYCRYVLAGAEEQEGGEAQ